MDSNHKKMLSMVSSLSKNYQKVLDMSLIAEEYYTNLMREAGPTVIGLWEVDIRKAEEFWADDRPAMDIYATKLEKPTLLVLAPLDPSGSALENDVCTYCQIQTVNKQKYLSWSQLH